VAHPADELLVQAGVQRRVVGDVQFGLAELFFVGWHHAPAHHVRHDLVPVADAQDGQAGVEQVVGTARRLDFVHRRRTTGEDNALGIVGENFLHGGVVGHDLAVHPARAHLARDELGVLRAKVQHNNRLVRDWIHPNKKIHHRPP
jgi:hypothetical protein